MSETTKTDHSGLRVLVAEDNLLIGEFIREILTELGCSVVGPTADLADTLRAIQSNKLDGALLDIELGKVNIYPAANELALKGIPFILATGREDLSGLPALLANAPFLTKPFDLPQLEHMIGRTFRAQNREFPTAP